MKWKLKEVSEGTMKKTYIPRGNEWVSTSQIDNLWEFMKAVSNYTVDQNGLLWAFIFQYLICLLLDLLFPDLPNPDKGKSGDLWKKLDQD